MVTTDVQYLMQLLNMSSKYCLSLLITFRVRSGDHSIMVLVLCGRANQTAVSSLYKYL